MDYADDIALLANIPAQAESLLHGLEQAAAGIGFHDIADKTECICFDQRGSNTTLNEIVWCHIHVTHWGWGYPSANVQSVYSTVPADRAKIYL